jgi:cobalt-zinc-cadmium efflux system outer membrane protein
MNKLWIIPLILWNLQAENFDIFLQKALKNSPYLKANALNIDRSQQEAALVQRYKNPTLSLEGSRFSSESAKRSEKGYRTALSQPLQLWGVGDDKAALAAAIQEQSRDFTELTRARFIQKISLLYIDYMQAAALEALSFEELHIAHKIEAISKERYRAGNIAKVKYLLTKLDTKRTDNLYTQRSVYKTSAYYKLLEIAGVHESDLESRYTFELVKKEGPKESVELAYIQSTGQKAQADAKLKENKIEWLSLYMEYEKEPEQSIARVGVDIPLALFNRQEEEKRVAMIEAKQKHLLLENQKRALEIKLKRIEKELYGLKALKKKTQALYRAQKEMLQMYEDGYKIANIKLIELQNLKAQMIETKEKAIILQSQIDRNIVNYNYNVGAYNEK